MGTFTFYNGKKIVGRRVVDMGGDDVDVFSLFEKALSWKRARAGRVVTYFRGTDGRNATVLTGCADWHTYGMCPSEEYGDWSCGGCK